MFKKISIFFIIGFCSLFALNDTNETEISIEQKHIKEQIKKEQQYAKEQKFYQGSEYNLKEKEIDPKSLKNIPTIEPEYDFDISEGVYSD